MDVNKANRLQAKNCEVNYPCKNASGTTQVMPDADASDEERAAYFKLPCHEQRAKCYKTEIDELNDLFLKPYNQKFMTMSIGFGVGMFVFIAIMLILIVVFIRRILADKKKLKAKPA